MSTDRNTPSVLFEEDQRLTMWWVWAIVAPIAVFGIAVAVWVWRMQFVLHQRWDDRATSDTEAIVFMVAMALAGLLPLAILAFVRLRVRVRPDVLTMSYRPFFRKRWAIDQVARAEARQFRPLAEYWGWGIRLSWQGRGWCYTVEGDRGVQVTLTSGKTFLIGSRRADELADAIRRAKASR